MVERLVPKTLEWRQGASEHLARYLFATQYVSGCRVLDAGTGIGYGAAILIAAGAMGVQAVDIDEETIKYAREQHGSSGVHYLVDDCETLERVETPLEVIVNFENIEHLKAPERFLSRASELLSEGGVLICSSPDRSFTDSLPDNPFHAKEWYREEFEELLSGYFGEVEFRSQIATAEYYARRAATEALKDHLKYLWGNPLRRTARKLASLFGKAPIWGDVTGLGAPQPSDFPVLPDCIAGHFGTSLCHVAICRKPKRTPR